AEPKPAPEQQTQEVIKEDKAASETAAESKPASHTEQPVVPPAATKAEVPPEKELTPPTPAPPADSEAAQPAPLGSQLDQLATDVDKPKEEKSQKPTVFDTTQYHLPIKPRSTNYVNNAVAWTLLVLVLLGVGGYVMYRLEILDLSRFGL